jgi:hypothetical protein
MRLALGQLDESEKAPPPEVHWVWSEPIWAAVGVPGPDASMHAPTEARLQL